MSTQHETTVAHRSDDARSLANLPDLLTVQELAGFLQLSTETIYYWRVTGAAPPAVKIGKHLRFPKPQLELWIDEHLSVVE